MFSGSYTAGLFYFLGQGDGTHADKVSIKQTSGEPVNPESALGAKMFDWDGDGDLDVITGTISGPVYFIENEGDLKFGKEVELTSNGEAISAPDGGVCFGDFNGDGLTDLVLGDDDNLAIYYCSEVGATELGDPDFLFKGEGSWEAKEANDAKTLVLKEPLLGSRIKPCVTDWNGDGKLDILAGDYTYVKAPAKDLTSAEKKELADLEEQIDELAEATYTYYDSMEEKILEKLGAKSVEDMTEEQMSRYGEAYSEVMSEDEGMADANEAYSTAYARISELRGEQQTHGFVWVFLQA